MKTKCGIVDFYCFTPWGKDIETIWEAYLSGRPQFNSTREIDLPTSSIPDGNEALLYRLESNINALKFADRTTLLVLNAMKDVVIKGEGQTMISVGSSRGATDLLERGMEYFTQHGRVQAYTSPMTTLGNITSFLAQSLGLEGLEIEHSMTCSTSSQSILNATAWLASGMADRVLAGAVEAPLTPFTIAQLKPLRIYTKSGNDPWPCRPLDPAKSANTLVLGEGAILALLARSPERPLLHILSFGYATEVQKHPVAVDGDGSGFQKSMRMALREASLDSVDVVICHATGTMQGDAAEMKAVDTVFFKKPLCTSTKWLTGHTFGMAGMHSLVLAYKMLDEQTFIGLPYLRQPHHCPAKIETVMINTLGFGGQVISMIVGR